MLLTATMIRVSVGIFLFYSISKINLKIYSLFFANLRINLYITVCHPSGFAFDTLFSAIWLHGLSNDCNAKQIHGYRNKTCI